MIAGRPTFRSRLTAILTMLGVAIGLGNVWRFPYMMGQYGGSAFLLFYLLFSLLFAVPAVMAEWGMGRITRRGPLEAFTFVLGPIWGRLVGIVLLVTVLVANSYYLVVIANVLYSAGFIIEFGFDEGSLSLYETQLANGWLQYGIALFTLSISLVVIYRGLRRGIEVVSRWFVPFFMLTVAYLVVYALTLEGATEELLSFLQPDFSALRAEYLFAALGQAFFSLGLGGTFLLIYGSYLSDDFPISGSAGWTVLGDAGAALMAALFIVPAVLVFNLDMTAGPGLIFSTLPRLFIQMPGGRMVGSLFLTALALVAFLSNIAALEVLVGSLADRESVSLKRPYIIAGVGLLEAVLMAPSALNPELIGLLDLIFGSGMQMLGSVITVLALAWGFQKRAVIRQVFADSDGSWPALFVFWIRWVLPGVLFCIFISYLYTTIVN